MLSPVSLMPMLPTDLTSFLPRRLARAICVLAALAVMGASLVQAVQRTSLVLSHRPRPSLRQTRSLPYVAACLAALAQRRMPGKGSKGGGDGAGREADVSDECIRGGNRHDSCSGLFTAGMPISKQNIQRRFGTSQHISLILKGLLLPSPRLSSPCPHMTRPNSNISIPARRQKTQARRHWASSSSSRLCAASLLAGTPDPEHSQPAIRGSTLAYVRGQRGALPGAVALKGPSASPLAAAGPL